VAEFVSVKLVVFTDVVSEEAKYDAASLRLNVNDGASSVVERAVPILGVEAKGRCEYLDAGEELFEGVRLFLIWLEEVSLQLRWDVHSLSLLIANK
jgi:hypothetical protein